MINGMTGRPRSGKSYEVVRYHIIPALQSGRKVFTNIPINKDVLISVYGEHIEELLVQFTMATWRTAKGDRPYSNVEDFESDWENEEGQGPLHVIDECHLVFPTGGTPEQVLEFLSMHGHSGLDLILITQNFRKVHRDIRDMIQIMYAVSKLSALGLENYYARKVMDGYRGTVLNEDQRHYDKPYFQFYKSHTQKKGAVIEATSVDVKPIWKHWSFMGAALFLGLGVPYFVWAMIEHNPLKPDALYAEVETVEPVPVVTVQASSNYVASQELVQTVPVVDLDTVMVEPKPRVSPFVKHLQDYTIYVGGHFDGLLLFTLYENGRYVTYVNADDLAVESVYYAQIAPCIGSLTYGDQEEPFSFVHCSPSTVRDTPGMIGIASGGLL